MSLEVFETFADSLKPIGQRKREYLDALEMNESEAVLYIFESYINGQKKQAKEVLSDLLTLLEADEFSSGLAYVIEVLGIFETAKISVKIEVKSKMLENVVYDNLYSRFSEYQNVIHSAYCKDF